MELSSLVILIDRETTIEESKNIRNMSTGKYGQAGHPGCLVTLLKKGSLTSQSQYKQRRTRFPALSAGSVYSLQVMTGLITTLDYIRPL